MSVRAFISSSSRPKCGFVLHASEQELMLIGATQKQHGAWPTEHLRERICISFPKVGVTWLCGSKARESQHGRSKFRLN